MQQPKGKTMLFYSITLLEAADIANIYELTRDKEKFAAIAQFPEPKKHRDLRGFIGPSNQLGIFIPDLAHMTSPLLPLTKRDVVWVWLQEHEDAFLKTKELLTLASLVKPFDESKEALMLTDASRL